jgi:hypothetical protein
MRDEHADILRVRPRTGAILLIALALATVAPELRPLETDRISVDLDWAAREIRVTIDRSVTAVGADGPTAVSRTQRSIRRDAAELLVEALAAVPFDSYHTIGTLVEERETLIAPLLAAAREARPVDSRASADLRRASVTFAVDLYAELAYRFVEHDRAAPVEPLLGWVATTEHTGILIYAADEMPVFGTGTRSTAEPALFPGLYYLREPQGELHLLTEAEHMDPATLASAGPVAYTADIQGTGLAERLGARPLRILAVGTFGARATDLVISETDARRILGSAHNISLLVDGRVVVVLPADRL